MGPWSNIRIRDPGFRKREEKLGRRARRNTGKCGSWNPREMLMKGQKMTTKKVLTGNLNQRVGVQNRFKKECEVRKSNPALGGPGFGTENWSPQSTVWGQ